MIDKLLGSSIFDQPREVQGLLKLLDIASERSKYIDFLHNIKSTINDFENRREVLSIGHFIGNDFVSFIHKCCVETGVRVPVASELLKRIVDWGLVYDNEIMFSNKKFRYQWNFERIKAYYDLNIIENVVIGINSSIIRYFDSVPAIFVEKDGNKYTGTGFVASTKINSKKCVIVTAKHNVNSEEGVRFIDFGPSNDIIFNRIKQKWILHPNEDLAAMPIQYESGPIRMYPVSHAKVLSRTVTLGFPQIGTSDGPYLLASSGELNAIIKTYYGEERLIISNAVQPGNSGGPVLDEAGLCMGMVVSAFEAKHEGGVSVINSAIPSKVIYEFIDPLCA